MAGRSPLLNEFGIHHRLDSYECTYIEQDHILREIGKEN